MASNSKYSNYFLFEKNKISCQQTNCDYFYTPKNEYGFPTTSLRKHLERHHPFVFSELVQSEKLEKDKNEDSQKLKQTSLKRMFSFSAGSASQSTSAKQPTIDNAFSIAGILPLFSLLERKMLSSEWTEEGFPVVREKIAYSLQERMKDWDTNKNLILSTVLDPHYKLFYFDEFLHERFKDYLLMEAEKVALKTVEESNETDFPAVEDIEMQNENDDPFEDFLRQRLILLPSSQPSPSIADAKAQAAGFPLLLPLVRKYHSATMSSSECERVFSAANYILDDRRKNLSMENLEMQLFLHENLLIYGFNIE
uniref:Dimer_Tnp_hAT domain-containing protein n=1 Tax=Meloidogyne hapla TaxID=6305 RepID=A0A1I8B9P6_MELHA